MHHASCIFHHASFIKLQKQKQPLKRKRPPKNNLPPPHLREYYLIFLMTSHLNSHRTTDIKPELLSCAQTGNGTPPDKYNIRGNSHARTNRKDDIFMQRRLVQIFTYIMDWGQGTCTLTNHTPRWTYYALRHFLFLIYMSRSILVDLCRACFTKLSRL